MPKRVIMNLTVQSQMAVLQTTFYLTGFGSHCTPRSVTSKTPCEPFTLPYELVLITQQFEMQPIIALLNLG